MKAGATEGVDVLLEAKVQAQERTIRILRKNLEYAHEEQLSVDRVKELLEVVREYNPNPPAWVLAPWKTTKRNPCIANLLVGDIHYDEVVNPLEIGGLNEYNTRISERRMRQLADTTIHLCRRHIGASVQGIVVTVLGDVLSGCIHDELDRTNEFVLPVAIMKCTDMMTAFINMIADEFERVQVGWIVGNHGRQREKVTHKRAAYENWEWLIGKLVERDVLKRHPKIDFKVSDSLEDDYQIYNKRFHFMHGNQMRGGSGIAGAVTPWMIGDFRRRKRARAMGQDYDYLVFGHWHARKDLGSIWANGSVKGFDEFAFDGGFTFETPQQQLNVFSPNGRLVYPLPIYLD